MPSMVTHWPWHRRWESQSRPVSFRFASGGAGTARRRLPSQPRDGSGGRKALIIDMKVTVAGIYRRLELRRLAAKNGNLCSVEEASAMLPRMLTLPAAAMAATRPL